VLTAALTSGLHPSPELTKFREEYKAKFNLESTPFAETSYDSIMMLAKVISDTKSTKNTDLQKAFNEVQGFKGISGDLSFNEKNHITISKDQVTLVKYDAAKKEWVEAQ